MANTTIRPINTGFIPTSPITYHYHHTTHKYYPNVTAEKTFLPDFIFLLDTGNELVLVDTGMAWTERADTYHHPGSYQPEGMAVHEQLEKLGIKPEDISHIIFTHLHWDHTFYMDKFKNAKFYSQRTEYEFAMDPIPLYYKSYEHPALGVTRPFEGIPFELIDGDEEVLKGIRVLLTPGHSPGHQAVEVDTKDGTYILAGDAIFLLDNLKPIPEIHYDITPTSRFADIISWWKSVERMKERATDEKLILPSHEPTFVEWFKETPVLGL
mgnify:CR=1 FL=1